ncbi:alpha/beta hydrolase [Actinomadura kijaniata]|uniref:alpha/beta hydrolase n=1 Tax=Actinomadura kijaniata TaxID=46161 RepID=UPI0008366C48|nr:alpha/beta hydrolase-fold protein [Actinomadura kijaniata]
MGLTSWSLLGLLALLTFGCMAATVWGWSRLAKPGPVRAAARLGVLVGTQVVVLLTLLTAVNKHYLFYDSWQGLMGAAGGDARQKQQTGRHNAVAAGNLGNGRVAASRADLKPRTDLNPAKGKPEKVGRVDYMTIQGVRTGIESEAYVYLPPQYFQPGYAQKRLPVALYIAGYPAANRLTWIQNGHIPEEVLNLGKAGKVKPMIHVMMRPTVHEGWDTECADVPGGPKVETFFAQDVPEAVMGAYRTARDRQGWGVAGYSAGGYCAVKLAMLHSDRFVAGATLGGHFRAILDTTTRQLYDRSRELRQRNNLIWRLENLPQPPVSIMVGSALVGEKTYKDAQKFMAAARPPLRVDKVLLPTGGHNFKTFRKYIPPTLEWMSDHLKGE